MAQGGCAKPLDVVLSINMTIKPLTLALVLALPTPAFGWGEQGHRLIGMLAEKRLRSDPNMDQKLTALLGPDVHLGRLALCADEIRGFVRDVKQGNPGLLPSGCFLTREEILADFDKTDNWHFINIPLAANGADTPHTTEVLRAACDAKPLCVADQIRFFQGQLVDPALPAKTRRVALMFLTHLIGDVHQPLHSTARAGDAGGNIVFVNFFSQVQKLHQVWDTSIISHINSPTNNGPLSDSELVELLTANPGPAPATGFDPQAWVFESFDAARGTAYKGLPNRQNNQSNPIKLKSAYQTAGAPVVRARLVAASVRLADVIAAALNAQ